MPGPPGFHVTVSLGVAAASRDGQADGVPFDEVLKAADGALYRAKAAGRNRVLAASAAVVSPVAS